MTQHQESSPQDLGEGLERALSQSSDAPKPAVDAKPAAEAKAAKSPAAKRVLPQVIEDAIARDVKVLLTRTGYEIDGFYKLGPVRVEPTAEGALVAIDRKDVSTPIKTFDDLVRLNYECWKKSRDKAAAYINPGREWVEEFGRLNLVKRQVIFVPGDD